MNLHFSDDTKTFLKNLVAQLEIERTNYIKLCEYYDNQGLEYDAEKNFGAYTAVDKIITHLKPLI